MAPHPPDRQELPAKQRKTAPLDSASTGYALTGVPKRRAASRNIAPTTACAKYGNVPTQSRVSIPIKYARITHASTDPQNARLNPPAKTA